MPKTLFDREQKILNHFFDNIDHAAVSKLLDLIKACKGMVITSGVGKSGLVAEKIALTLTSTGTRAFFLAPLNALHGDIGIVSKDDIFLLFSKSGESEELLQLLPAMRNKGSTIISIGNTTNSRLAKSSDYAITLPLAEELCAFNLVPTTSMITHLILGDVMAVALMEYKKFSLSEYALNHPSGKIGRRLTLRVSDLMLSGKDLPICKPQDKLVDSLVELSNKRCGCVLISDPAGKLAGIFTDGDLRRNLQKKGAEALSLTMEELMTKSPRCIEKSQMASEALVLMEADQQHPITALAVVDHEQKISGLIKLHDILQSGL